MHMLEAKGLVGKCPLIAMKFNRVQLTLVETRSLVIIMEKSAFEKHF